MIVWDNANSPFSELMSLSDAAKIWGIDSSTLRKAIADDRLYVGLDCAKFGKQWVISAAAMHRFTNDWAPWSRYLVDCRKRKNGKENDIDKGKVPNPDITQ